MQKKLWNRSLREVLKLPIHTTYLTFCVFLFAEELHSLLAVLLALIAKPNCPNVLWS